MPVLIDTNIAIFLTDGRSEVKERLAALDAPPVISLITLVELEGGVHKEAEFAAVRRLRLDALLRWVEVLPFDQEVVAIYGAIVASLGFSRPRLLDRLIAATALFYGQMLVTTNGADFQNIPGLELEVWPRPTQ